MQNRERKQKVKWEYFISIDVKNLTYILLPLNSLIGKVAQKLLSVHIPNYKVTHLQTFPLRFLMRLIDMYQFETHKIEMSAFEVGNDAKFWVVE